jgi:hypothetical protein
MGVNGLSQNHLKKGDETMKKLIKILHIDPGWKVIYILIRGGALVKTAVSLKTALTLLKKQKFDLILSEPQNIAIVSPETAIPPETMRRLPFSKKIQNNHWEWGSCANGG